MHGFKSVILEKIILHNISHASIDTNTQKYSVYHFLASRIVPITYILLPLLDQMNSTTQVVTEEQDLHVFILDDQELRWFSVGIFKYKAGYRSHDLLLFRVLSLVENLFEKNPLPDLLSSLNTVISTNESTRIITGHVVYNPSYSYKFQLKTT
jgi:hypothetical protein